MPYWRGQVSNIPDKASDPEPELRSGFSYEVKVKCAKRCVRAKLAMITYDQKWTIKLKFLLLKQFIFVILQRRTFLCGLDCNE